MSEGGTIQNFFSRKNLHLFLLFFSGSPSSSINSVRKILGEAAEYKRRKPGNNFKLLARSDGHPLLAVWVFLDYIAHWIYLTWLQRSTLDSLFVFIGGASPPVLPSLQAMHSVRLSAMNFLNLFIEMISSSSPLIFKTSVCFTLS